MPYVHCLLPVRSMCFSCVLPVFSLCVPCVFPVCSLFLPWRIPVFSMEDSFVFTVLAFTVSLPAYSHILGGWDLRNSTHDVFELYVDCTRSGYKDNKVKICAIAQILQACLLHKKSGYTMLTVGVFSRFLLCWRTVQRLFSLRKFSRNTRRFW